MSETVRNTPEHRHVEFRDINLIPCLVAISLPEKDITVGNALFLHNEYGGQAILWHIFVRPEYRKKGFGKALIDHAKIRWSEIATDWEGESGHEFCLKCGFQSRKTDMLRLVWKRKE
jgi:GNAT superfamily N-acetyltransferase